MGPTEDGGAYLIGYSKKYFDSKEFSAISWQTSNVLIELKQLAATNEIYELQTKADIDSPTAIDKSILLTLPTGARKLIEKLVSKLAIITPRRAPDGEHCIQLRPLELRGPPSIA